MASDNNYTVPDTTVLAIASHVVFGYVGNKMATCVMQAFGVDVSALNTVHFSNHTAYKQVKGTKSTGEEVLTLYEGLKQSRLHDFDVMLTGYCPSADVVEAVGKIARELKYNATMKPGSFFWILDPVMGDNGRLYVNENVVPVYRELIGHADLIVPNAFELETLSGHKVDSLSTLNEAIEALHREHRTAHIVVTSVKLGDASKLSVVGSTRTSDHRARTFKIDVPAFDVFFSGTGDFFASLMTVRLREAAFAAGVQGQASWISPDDVPAPDLPLAKACEKVLSSMQAVLEKTVQSRQKAIDQLQPRQEGEQPGVELDEKRMHLALTKAAEIRVPQHVRDLLHPQETYHAEAVESSTLPHLREGP